MSRHDTDLNRVAVFARVVEERSFTAAARTLGLPKSSVSRAVSLLEEELSSRLLRRTTRKLTLTEAGAAFYERASKGLAALVEAREAVTDLETELRGRVRVTAPSDLGGAVLAPLVTRFVAEHPAVRVELSLTARVVDLVEEGFDLGVRAGALRDPSLVARPVCSVDFALYASRAYLARHAAPKRVANVAKHRCVVFRPVAGRATWTLAGPDGAESADVEAAIGADDFVFVREAIRAGAGIGLLPAFPAPGWTEGLVRVLAAHVAPGSPFHIVYPPSRYVPNRVAALRDFLLAALGGKPVARGEKAGGKARGGAAAVSPGRAGSAARRGAG